MPRVSACMVSMLWVHTAPARPYSVALARRITCRAGTQEGEVGGAWARSVSVSQVYLRICTVNTQSISMGSKAAASTVRPARQPAILPSCCPAHLVDGAELEDDLHRTKDLVPARGGEHQVGGMPGGPRLPCLHRGHAHSRPAVQRPARTRPGPFRRTWRWPCHPPHHRTVWAPRKSPGHPSARRRTPAWHLGCQQRGASQAAQLG